jgi:hypothetical protein
LVLRYIITGAKVGQKTLLGKQQKKKYGKNKPNFCKEV